MINKSGKSKKKYTIISIVVAILIVLIVLYYTIGSRKELSRAESFIKDGTISVQKIVTKPIDFVENKIEILKSLSKVKEENDKLEAKVSKLKALETENKELKKEINNLKKELGVESVLSDYDKINATVIVRNVSYWYNIITIDKGKKDGVEVGMVVINGTGVIGKVISTSNSNADVKLITTNDTNNKISAAVISGDNKLYGVINGYDYDNKIATMEGISNTDTVNSGDLVYTSGLGGVFPSGILIGTVANIKTDSYDLSKIIAVTLSADFDDLNYVTVLKRKSDSGAH